MTSTMIKCFLETAKCGSFTKAASNLYFTQQTVSKYVSMLEKELHVPLLEREGAGVRLTKPGSYYYALFENCWYNLSAVREKIDGYYKNLNSTLRIGCSEWINPYGDIFDAIEGFRRQNSGIRYSLRIYQNEHLMEHLMNEELDVALFSEAHL
ncbi:MAG: LysR family transcriptional regulator, partial [Oscillospiraceae bacterium]